MDTEVYANQLEKKLILEFREKFKEKLGYYPHVVTRQLDINSKGMPTISLKQLKTYFSPFLPEEFGSRMKLEQRSRKRELIELRMIYVYLAKSMGYTYSVIGKSLDGQDHTTVIHSIKTFNDLMDTSEAFQNKFNKVYDHVKNSIKMSIHESSIMADTDQTQCEPQSGVLPGLSEA